MPTRKSGGYRQKRRQILDKIHNAKIPLPTSLRNKRIITKYHNALFGHTVKVDGRRRHKPGLLSREYNIQSFTPADAAVVKKTLTFHGKPINAGLPRLGNTLITQPGRIKVRKRTIAIKRRHVTQIIPRVDRKRFITDRQRAFEEAAHQQPRNTDIAIRIGSHVLPGRYADLESARREYDRLSNQYRDQPIDVAIEFVRFENQDEA